ncbi:hypothetical protein MLD38_023958 [Melastoma candidum]|uniref:Uncharacterized protein n=1 Tax=Melastoma candidum TaxID=119954 RepID=A0ACB9NS34_9MYRT|nr:hypothetical protein MLD38_023958 [Melastoma candidum]
MMLLRLILLLVLYSWGARAATDSSDYVVLQAIRAQWTGTPVSWSGSDPCGESWAGISCDANGRVTRLQVIGISGQLVSDLWMLTALTSLDLSSNPNLVGSISRHIQNLQALTTLNLAYCNLSGNIPETLGTIAGLSFLVLNSNNFVGGIPAALGNLSNLYWFDISDNQLTGSLPVSTSTSPGLDLLLTARHFHFGQNRLSGQVPEQLFSSQMSLIHILLDGNQFDGPIPSSLGLVQSLQVLRLDHNAFSDNVPQNLNNLTSLSELYLAGNQLNGSLPNLGGMSALTYVDLSNNSFDPSPAPAWFSTLQSLSSLIIENGSLQGTVPQSLFTLPQLQEVKFRNNNFNGTLNIGTDFSRLLELVDLQDNQIVSMMVNSGGYNNTLILMGNPICTSPLVNSDLCQLPTVVAYSTDLSSCGNKLCASIERLIPVSCGCAVPLMGNFTFTAPSTISLSNKTLFKGFEQSLWTQLNLTANSVELQNIQMNNSYLQVQVYLFPSSEMFFTRSEFLRIGYELANRIYNSPNQFGPYTFFQYPYVIPGNGGSGFSRGVVAGIVSGCAVLVIGLVLLAFYAFRQKKRAERAMELSRPFGSWGGADGNDNGEAPRLKGARWFSFEELKKCTNNFSQSNELGQGGYGKVYRGIHSDGQILAIKRAQQGSMQGAQEFKTEIELLSRVHHRNLVGLVGFCFDQGEQMLAYEFMANGNLRESLAGQSGIFLDWKRRLRITLGSASGLAYLHELANPPIIHRDVKSTNILLDENLTAKVADFGLSKLVSDGAKGHVSTQVKGTLGYLDPEYYMTQQLTEKSDVYSFGVVMLELITAKQPIEKGKYIVREIRTVMDRNDRQYFGLGEIMDPALRNGEPLIGLGTFLDLAMRCVEDASTDRPSMSEVVKVIDQILQENEMNSNPTSAASSANEFAGSRVASRHPYSDVSLKSDTNYTSSFDYSGSSMFSKKIEPK